MCHRPVEKESQETCLQPGAEGQDRVWRTYVQAVRAVGPAALADDVFVGEGADGALCLDGAAHARIGDEAMAGGEGDEG